MARKNKIPSCTISARVPVVVADEIKRYLEKTNQNMSQYIQRSVKDNVNVEKYSTGGSVNIVDNEAEELLIPILSGAGIGTGVYYLIKKFMEKEYPDKDAEQAAIMGSIAIGLGSMITIGHFMNKK